MRPISALVVVLSVFAAPALAAQGEVCASKPSATNEPLTNDTVFECEAAGKGTIPELYAKGWRVVSVFPQVSKSQGGPLSMATEWAIVIEKI